MPKGFGHICITVGGHRCSRRRADVADVDPSRRCATSRRLGRAGEGDGDYDGGDEGKEEKISTKLGCAA